MTPETLAALVAELRKRADAFRAAAEETEASSRGMAVCARSKAWAFRESADLAEALVSMQSPAMSTSEYKRLKAQGADPQPPAAPAPAPSPLDLLAALKLAAPAFCSLRCPSVFRSPDEPRHIPECEAIRAAIQKEQNSEGYKTAWEEIDRVYRDATALLAQEPRSYMGWNWVHAIVDALKRRQSEAAPPPAPSPLEQVLADLNAQLQAADASHRLVLEHGQPSIIDALLLPPDLDGPAGGARGEADARERDAGSPQSTGASAPPEPEGGLSKETACANVQIDGSIPSVTPPPSAAQSDATNSGDGNGEPKLPERMARDAALLLRVTKPVTDDSGPDPDPFAEPEGGTKGGDANANARPERAEQEDSATEGGAFRNHADEGGLEARLQWIRDRLVYLAGNTCKREAARHVDNLLVELASLRAQLAELQATPTVQHRLQRAAELLKAQQEASELRAQLADARAYYEAMSASYRYNMQRRGELEAQLTAEQQARQFTERELSTERSQFAYYARRYTVTPSTVAAVERERDEARAALAEVRDAFASSDGKRQIAAVVRAGKLALAKREPSPAPAGEETGGQP